jgi:hypothetical protein
VKAEPKNDPSRFTRKEAKRTLDEVRRRYGIHESVTQAHPHVNRSVRVPTEVAKQTGPTLTPEPSASKARVSRVGQMQSKPPMERAKARHPIIHASGPASDNRSFHYLIRIAECALTLLCEVITDSEAAAKHHVKQIPNLLEWREISGEEFVNLVRNLRQPYS